MTVPKARSWRNPPQPLPLFVWAANRNRHALPILPTHIPQTLALARRYRLPVVIAAVIAEALEARS